jgi:hypothetical protein
MSPNGIQEHTLGRVGVPTTKLFSSQHLSRGEHRRGSVGGARHEISQIGTGAFPTGVALAVAPPRGSRAPREGGSGDQGGSSGLSANAAGSLHRCSRTIATWSPFRDEGKNPPRSPHPPRRGSARGREGAGGHGGGGPLLDRTGFGIAGWGGGTQVSGAGLRGR